MSVIQADLGSFQKKYFEDQKANTNNYKAPFCAFLL